MNRPKVLIFSLACCLALGGWLRATGLTRGASDFALPEQVRAGETEAFYHFHPDEATLVHAALELDNPFHPPLTAYGLLPLYLARGVLKLVSLWERVEPADLAAVRSQRLSFYAIRLVAVLLSGAGLWLVWEMGRRHLGRGSGVVAAFFVAAAPLAVQQAHFFTVDGMFTPLALVAFHALLTAVCTRQRRHYLVAGALIGATAAVRLNGLLLGAVLLGGHCFAGEEERRGSARLLDPRLWAAGGAALLVLVGLQPFLVTDPGLLWQARSTDDFAFSLKVARGEILRPWSLADVHTRPYLHYWTHLWPLGAGWPLTLAFGLGLAHALWKRKAASLLLAGWGALYFLSIGGLHTKHVRYLLPLLPFLSLLAADLCIEVWRRNRYAGGLLTGGLVFYTAIYGLAFARIYRVEDSRIQAGRWIAAHAPGGSRIGFENGGFSMQRLISGERFGKRPLNMSTLFGSRGYLICRPAIDYLQERVQALDYIAVTDVNRYQQFTAVPELYPVAAEFYRRLWAGELGFVMVRRFKVCPALGGVEFCDDGAEPSFVGYDHPAVLIFKRQDPAAVEKAWADWRRETEEDSCCADEGLRQVARLFQEQEWEKALSSLRAALRRRPDLGVGHLIGGMIHRRLGNADREKAAVKRYQLGFAQGGAAYLKPWASAASLVELELMELAMTSLVNGAERIGDFSADTRRQMATSYIHAGRLLRQRGRIAYAGEVYQLATEIHPGSETYVDLGIFLYEQGEIEASSRAYAKALAFDADHAVARINLGWNCYLRGDLEEAVEQFSRAAETGRHSAALFNLGLAYLAQGGVQSAEEAYARAVAEFGAAEGERIGAVEELRELVARGVEAETGRRILDTYWPE